MTRTATSRNKGVAGIDSPRRGIHRVGVVVFSGLFFGLLIMAPGSARAKPSCACFQATGGGVPESALNIAQNYTDANFAVTGVDWTCTATKSRGNLSVRVFNTLSNVDDRRLHIQAMVSNANCRIIEFTGAAGDTVVNEPAPGGEKAACNKALKPVCTFVRLTAP